MIVFTRKDKYICFATSIQGDAENSLDWILYEHGKKKDYCVTTWNPQLHTKSVFPCPYRDPFIIDLMKDITFEETCVEITDEDASHAIINQYVKYWKDKGPFKSFME